MEKKALIRKEMINLLKSFDFADKSHQGQIILEKLLHSKKWKAAKSVALYMPQEFEFDLKLLFEQENKQILIPKTLENRQMIFAKYDKNDLERTKFGILEPRSKQAEIPDLILVPGLAWNHQGDRIGFGAGYYDRYLANFKGQTASVCYDFQQINFDPEPHDIRVGEIFTYEH
ncbi:5-formyltetrahydrofolate cyclo-ligase [Lactococcus garvieae]|jgi:5-formyltetrahydrofolate cyclo-ligase|uniref:5-formyltetrahydrofolate cyclo-ligase n=1 Tax=Lactococcus garvieae DCC43 TaxID=1231377 RepID=K2NW04_9LACT|nr:5-formyltetrahydrofolate cyclo-ligase [Lactococcus garvieae]EKF51743.1 5-formyltetrahydrofolate cyclo-ligase [Lactococcus garvieae DCC43]